MLLLDNILVSCSVAIMMLFCSMNLLEFITKIIAVDLQKLDEASQSSRGVFCLGVGGGDNIVQRSSRANLYGYLRAVLKVPIVTYGASKSIVVLIDEFVT